MGKTRSVMLETDDGRWELPVNPKEISVTQEMCIRDSPQTQESVELEEVVYKDVL